MVWVALPTIVAWGIAIWLLRGVARVPGAVPKVRRLLASIVWASLGAWLGGVLLILHLFSAFTGETWVARVTARRLSTERFELTYLPAPPIGGASAGASSAAATVVQLEGDQWAVSGGVVKWHPWLTALGLKSYHRPMRLSGQFSRPEAQRAHRPTLHAFEPPIDPFWELLYRSAPYLPFVEAVYGSSAYVYVEPGIIQDIYVTASGYLIKRGSRN